MIPGTMAAAVSVDEAFAYCEARAKAHYENFPVGLFVPKDKRPYVYSLYAFARAADDFADEPVYDGMRRQKLDDWEALLHAAYRGEAEGPIFVALGETVRRLAIPKELLLDLLSAFRQDTEKRRYATWDELLDYCRRSANPVGRLVLHLVGRTSPEHLEQSDCICTALQLINFWQDVAVDWQKNRVYIPQTDLPHFGICETDIAAGRWSPHWERLMLFEIERAERLMQRGQPLVHALPGRLGWEIRLTVQGGLRILERIDAVAGDVFAHRPQLTASDWLVLLWRSFRM